ncbi:Uncharacterised protein [Kingella potus]|uniref:Uncharacterized protein n=1 Tax=Kingella potus TaxID=265175 RepID=A0A377R3Y8_9NEIS|nr:hypothetical protein [Kingella potus]UOP00575.1 hypothetical protein LVJ84_12165 [Kingella potus]UOP02046.1 hypothetical protein LVJ84_14440 [Kingella potus]STR03033.1 Uncharacterised protein [Kingella potus]STR03078.1 Uncharacterised protein [Kingella potus]
MNPIRQREEVRQMREQAERSAELAERILENALRQKAAAAACEQKALRCLIINTALAALVIGLWLGMAIGDLT